jgi:hypothetical protein
MYVCNIKENSYLQVHIYINFRLKYYHVWMEYHTLIIFCVVCRWMKKILATVMAAVASILAIGAVILEDIRSKRLLRREPHVNREYERGIYMDSILYGGKQDCIDQIRMSPTSFFGLYKILADNNLIRETINMSIKEQVLMFLHIIGHNVRFRVVGGRFYRSIEFVHRYFRVVLIGVLRLYKHLIRKPNNSTRPEIRNSQRFYPYFKVCLKI